MGVVYRVDVGDDLGVRDVASSFDDYSGDEPQGQPGIADVVAPVGDYLDISADAALAFSGADASLDITPAVVRDPLTVDSRYAVFNADEFVVVQGKPRAVTDLTCRVQVSMSVSGLRELETYPDPEGVQVDAQARWLPQIPRYPASLQWFPFSVDGQQDELIEGGQSYEALAELTYDDMVSQPWFAFSGAATIVTGAQGDFSWYSSSGAPPRVVSNYTFLRGDTFVTGSAMSFRRGQYMYSDTLALETGQITLAACAVLRVPRGEWYTVLEVTPTLTGFQSPLSVRYHRSGVLSLWSDDVLGEIRLQAGVTRPNQPVIVALGIDFDSVEVTLAAVDTATHLVVGRLQQRPELQPRLYLGRSTTYGADASMELLEVDYWTRELSRDQLVARLAVLDRMYGVSAS